MLSYLIIGTYDDLRFRISLKRRRDDGDTVQFQFVVASINSGVITSRMSIQNTKTKSLKEIQIFSSEHSSQTSKKLFMDEKTADVYFVFNSNTDKRIRVAAHKNILAKGSSVFESMFYGGITEEGDVEIVDASVDGFKEFLQFFYVNKVELTMENIAEVLNLANKYNVNECLNVCDKMLEENATLQNLCNGLQLATTFERNELKKSFLQKVSQQPKDVLASMGFYNCSHDVLKLLLTSVDWKCDTKEVFDACMVWAKQTCEKDKMDASMENRRKQLGECLHLIQFDLMSQQQIAQCILNYRGLFDKEELEDIIALTMSDTAIEIKTFKGLTQTSGKAWSDDSALTCSRIHNPSLNKNYVNQLESISFQTSKKVLFGAIAALQIQKSDPNYFSNKISGIVLIFETTSNENSEKSVLLLKQQINVTSGDATDLPSYIKLSKPIVIVPYKLYEIRMIFHSLWKHQTFHTNFYYKQEVQLDDDIQITFEKNPSLPYDNCSFGIISDLYFNRLDNKSN